jgi:hypothetical protein
MKEPRCIFQFWVFFFLVFCSYPTSVFAEKKSYQILRSLDSTYYYPQKNGLTSLLATVIWEKGVSAGGKFKKNSSVKFSWNGVSDKRTFKVTGESLKTSNDEQNSLLQFFSNYKEVLLPQTLTEKFSRYSGKVSHGNFGTRINLEIDDFQDGVSRYSLFINDKQRNVSRMLIDRVEAPTKVIGVFKYIQKSGLWLVAESVARFNFGGQSHIERTLYYYGQIENIWLVNRIEQTLRKEGKEISRFTFKVKDYLLNWSNN